MQVDISAWGDKPPQWIVLLAGEVERAGQIQRAAARIGVNRATVSTCLRNCYPAGTSRIERRVMRVLGQLECPAQQKVITADQCQTFREKPAPTHNPNAMQCWKLCQHCKHNPARQE